MELWRLFYEEVFTLAYRESGNLLFQHAGQDVFISLPLNKSYWCADPFVFKHKDIEYLFYEYYDMKKDKGLIAYSRIDNNGNISNPTIVLEADYHLSFPLIFESEGSIYMLPETGSNRTIELFIALDFPLKWEKSHILKKDIQAVDSTLILQDDSFFLFTTVEDKKDNTLTQLLFSYAGKISSMSRIPFALSGMEPHPQNPVHDSPDNARSAGAIFQDEGGYIRPTQDCSGGEYGKALEFWRITVLNSVTYADAMISRIAPTDIRTTLTSRIYGIHSYARGEKYEFIDLKIRRFYFPQKAIRFVKRAIRKIFRHHKNSLQIRHYSTHDLPNLY